MLGGFHYLFSFFQKQYILQLCSLSSFGRTTSTCKRSSSWKVPQYPIDLKRFDTFILTHLTWLIFNKIHYYMDKVNVCVQGVSQFSSFLSKACWDTSEKDQRTDGWVSFRLLYNPVCRCVACPARVAVCTRRRTAGGSGATTSWTRRARRGELLWQLCGWGRMPASSVSPL